MSGYHSGRCFCLLVVGVVMLATACSSSRDEAPACPDVAVVSDAASLTRFAPGEGRDLLDVDIQVEIADLVSACKDTDKRDGQPIAKVVVAPVIVASRGSANRELTQRVSYFVSVVDANQQILRKEIYTLTLDFTDNRNRLVIRDDDPPITVDIPNAKRVNARGYQILIGFQLTPEELEYNRRGGQGGVAPGALTRQSGPLQ